MFPSSEQETFVILLQKFGLYQPEELYKVVCPFHGDVNASMQINVSKAFFYCYGCGAKGSSTELYQEFYKQENNKEINALQAKLEISKIVKNYKKKHGFSELSRTRTSHDSITNTSISGLFCLPNISVVEKESYSQGITEARNYFYNLPEPCWYRPSKVPEIEEETRVCLQYMLSRGFTKNTLTKAQAKPSLNSNYPIVIPLLENGIFRGYVSRTFDKEIEQQRKYMYNRGFKRERTLAGNYKKATTVLVVEGYLDCLKVKQLGFVDVVAILGWKISSTQIHKLKRANVEHIICGTDNDEAGKKGYNYLRLLQKQQTWYKLSRVKFQKGIKDFGDLQKGTKEADRMVLQLKKLGLK